MAAYFLVDIHEIKDAAKWDEYRSRIRAVTEKFGGRYLVVGGPFEVKEGPYAPVFPVMIEFASMEAARRWYDSDEYRELKQIRLAATTSFGVFLAGMEQK